MELLPCLQLPYRALGFVVHPLPGASILVLVSVLVSIYMYIHIYTYICICIYRYILLSIHTCKYIELVLEAGRVLTSCVFLAAARAAVLQVRDQFLEAHQQVSAALEVRGQTVRAGILCV